MKNSRYAQRGALFFGTLLFVSGVLFPTMAHAGKFLVNPVGGAFTVGSTFDVQIFLDTDGQSVNALDVDLIFPPDKLQLVSPKTSVSVIEVWTSQPKFNNQSGRVRLQGGIPRGVNVDNALVATLTFRAKSVGSAIIRFGDESKILLNDGLGTNDLRSQGNAFYKLLLPPPEGPIVVSETHPNQGTWYSNPNAVLRWSVHESVSSYSFILDTNPTTAPDDISEGKEESVAYKNLTEGQHYFHIKAYRNGSWGGVTHFAIDTDTEPPAKFPIEVLPGLRTTVKSPVIKFATTDTLSGINRYEIKIVSLYPISAGDVAGDVSKNYVSDEDFFIEAESPYVSPNQEVGPHDVIVRAYDKAGNVQEITERFIITNRFFSWSSTEGVIIGSWLIPWIWLFLALLLFIFFLLLSGYAIKKRHDAIVLQRKSRDLPFNVQLQLEELRRFKKKYGGAAVFLLLIGSLLSPISFSAVHAEEERGGVVELSPPYVTTVSKDVSNDEIFYVGGKTENRDTQVIIYTQNLTSGETTSYEVKSDKGGEWFYRHNTFLTPGKYVLWTQAKIGDITSPPSPQVELSVARAALTFGVTRISYETLYAVTASILVLIILLLILYILYHYIHHRKKHHLLLREIREAEESIKRGFAVLRKDIERELGNLQASQQGLLTRDHNREAEILRDLKSIEDRIGKEVWDIERVEQVG